MAQGCLGGETLLKPLKTSGTSLCKAVILNQVGTQWGLTGLCACKRMYRGVCVLTLYSCMCIHLFIVYVITKALASTPNTSVEIWDQTLSHFCLSRLLSNCELKGTVTWEATWENTLENWHLHILWRPGNGNWFPAGKMDVYIYTYKRV